jgi:hypothetical protein
MFNYHTEKRDQTHWYYEPNEQAFIIIAQQPISKGEAISVNYGTKSSSRYLHYYGFIPENNIYESVPIDLQLHKEDPLLKEKQRILNIDTVEIRRLEFSMKENWLLNKNDKVMSYLRFIEYEGDSKILSTVFFFKN